jgi:DNA-binding response OmpR family regulator
MGRNILVVEDDRNICDLIHMYLVKEGFDVRIAGDGGKAIEEFKKQAPDLILLDIMLPVMDGWAVCAKIRETSKVPIIMLTAKSEVFDRIQGLEMGADDYIVKPFEMKELIARINAVLRGRRSQRHHQAADLRQAGDRSDSYELIVDARRSTRPPRSWSSFTTWHPLPTGSTPATSCWMRFGASTIFGDSRTVDVHNQAPAGEGGGRQRPVGPKTVWGVGVQI